MSDDIKIDAEFKESDHPRSEDGKFGSGEASKKSGKGNSSNRSGSPVSTPEFKNWFGNSQVVDDSGEPLIVYHGSDTNIRSFDKEKTQDSAFWFSSNKGKIEGGESGAASTEHIIPVYLKAEKLAGWDEYDQYTYDQLIDMGYDGIKLDDDYIVFEPNQIKSATKNKGKFDPASNNIADADGVMQSKSLQPVVALDDLAIAEKMASGEIDQIVATDKCLLVPMRITGTGITEREIKDANGITVKYPCDRPADVFLSERFLKMCNGLPVAFYHPQNGEGFTSLNFDNWKEYVVGTIFYPYIKGTEVWGVAKVFDLSMLDAFRDGIASTSPFVTSKNEIGDGVYVEKLEDINHVAIVPAGHWDTDQPAITANKEIQTKEDLMADENKPVEEKDKPDANVMQVSPPAEPVKPDAEVETPAEQSAEDDRVAKLEQAVSGITTGLAEVQATLKALVESDKEVHAEVEDPVVGEDEEKKAEAVNALTEMADAAHAEVKIVKPVPMAKESVPEYKRRIIAHNIALVDPDFAGLAKVKADSAIEPLLDKGIASIGANAKKKSEELYKAASSTKNARVVLGDGKVCIPNF